MAWVHHIDSLHAIAGLLVGLLVGLTGVGGGSLMTPLLVLMFGVNPTTAVGTDLLYASATKTVGSGVHGWRETVDWRIMQRLALGSIPAALMTLLVLSRVGPLSKAVQGGMMVGLACMLVLTSATVFFQKRLINFAVSKRHREQESRHARTRAMRTVALGAVIGLAVSLTSVGAGAIGVTALLMLYPTQPVARIVGTDIAHAVPLTLVAGMGHWIIGDVDGGLLLNLLIGSVPGVIVGSLISSRASDNVLRPLLGTVLALSAWQLYVKAIKVEAPKAKPATQVVAQAGEAASKP